MMEFNREEHWENIYSNKEVKDCSWYQPHPVTAIEFIQKEKLNVDAKIIDVGGGDGFLVDYLLDQGYKNITILDISEKAIEKAKVRLGERAKKVNWVVSDIIQFDTIEKFDFWFDRAAFHFLTEPADVVSYVKKVNDFTSTNSKVVIGTFSKSGPKKCSGIDIQQYDAQELSQVFSEQFDCQYSKEMQHQTPFNTIQDFIFCSFNKKS